MDFIYLIHIAGRKTNVIYGNLMSDTVYYRKKVIINFFDS